jgi:hypothetical protein
MLVPSLFGTVLASLASLSSSAPLDAESSPDFPVSLAKISSPNVPPLILLSELPSSVGFVVHDETVSSMAAASITEMIPSVVLFIFLPLSRYES